MKGNLHPFFFMGIFSILFIAVGLSMDAFAVALASGRASVPSRMRHALRLGAAFGLAQMIMPLLGWALGSQLRQFITAFDHWIAFGLLAFIGGKMVRESFSGDACEKPEGPMSPRRLLLLSLATSIDALVVGLSLAFLGQGIFWASALIGLVTFVIATAGGIIGCCCCCVWGRRAELFGGVVLILIGSKILLDHLRS